MLDIPITALESLRCGPFMFELTGSRKLFPNYIQRDSDWDFFVEDSEEVRKFLEGQGYKVNSVSHYLDTELVIVYSKDNVDVQLRKNSQKWSAKQKKLMVLPEYSRYLMLDSKVHTRDQLSELWNSL